MTRTPFLSQRLAQVRRRLVAIGGVAGIGWGIAAAVAILAAAVWLDLIWDLPPAARIASWAIVIPTALAVAAICLGRAWRRADSSFLASRLDAVGGTPGTIAAGWSLATGGVSDASPLTAGLAGIAVARAEREAASVSAARVAPFVAARPAAIAACVAAMVVACFAIAAPEMAATQWRRFVQPFEDTAPYSLVTILVEPGDARVAYGAGLDILVRTEGPPVERVDLVLRGENGADEVLPMFADGDGDYRTTLASIIAPTHYHVRADAARSQGFHIDVVTVPRLENLRVRIAPPDYTRMAAYEGPLPPDGIAGLLGTQVTVEATSNRPLSGGVMQFVGTSAGDGGADDGASPEPLMLEPLAAGADTVRGSFQIERSGTFELRVIDVAGETSVDAYAGTIVVTEDQRPFVRLLRPKQTSLAVPTAIIPVQWSAEDDFGVAHLTLFRSLNASQWLPLTLPASVPTERQASGMIELPLAAYGLEPGDEISLFVRVEDNDPAGAKGAESNVAKIRIISQAEFDSMMERQYTFEMLASKYRQVQRRLAALKAMNKRLQKNVADRPADAEIDPADREALEALQKRLAKDIEELSALAKVALPFDLDQALTDDLERHIDRLREAAEALDESAGKPSLKSGELAEALADLARQLQDAGEDVAAGIMPPIEHLEAILPLLAAEEAFIELARRQRDLAERIAALEGNQDRDEPARKARFRDLALEQGDIHRRLDDLLTEIEERADQLPDDEKLETLRETAKRFAEDVRDTFVFEDMAEAESWLAGSNAPRAASAAMTAADKLDLFVKKCEGGQGMQGAGCECLGFGPSLAKPMQGTIAQLLARMRGKGNVGSGMTGQGQTGMYGQLPVALGMLGGDGESDDAAGPPGAASAPGGPDRPNTVTAFGPNTSAPTTRHEAPATYRRRVADYFRRLAEDLEENP